MNSRKVKEIVKFYIQKNVQNKWFVLVNIVILITMLVSTNASHIKNFLESKDIELFKEEFKIEIIDKENLAKEEILKHSHFSSNALLSSGMERKSVILSTATDVDCAE